ncbi:intercellular adhesion molecule 1-like [Paramormyrops kingsleyae]|uniref:intercellular adhesion molecule 1-like n=1 Tax=Paramormyrops kingsleyae TaxID=1676925 RepID=UPI003B96E957
MRSTQVSVVWLILSLRAAAAGGCLELHPPRVVVRHGDPVSVNCTVSRDHSGMGWKAPVDDVPITPGVQFLTWRVESLRIWDLMPLCYANRPGKPQCKERLSVTVYKPPDSVSVSSVKSAHSMVEESQYQLKCEIQNIAPVQSLTVKWYKGDTLVHEDRDYVIEDGKTNREKEPVSVSSTLLITPSRADDKVQYSCGAELDLGPEGPQPPLAVKSKPIRITVHYPKQTWILTVVVTLAVVILAVAVPSICCFYVWKRDRPRARMLAESQVDFGCSFERSFNVLSKSSNQIPSQH